MKAELENYLVSKYPQFFEYLRENETPMIDGDKPLAGEMGRLFNQKKMVLPMQFGFECGDGWFPILDALMGDIQNHIENVNMNRENQFRHEFPKWLQRKAYRLPWKRKLLKKFLLWITDRFPMGVDPMPPVSITQVKEKFGGLRFYYNGGDDFIYGLETMAESMSYRTCEYCGATKDVGHTQEWIITCCKSCINSNERLKNYIWKPIEKKLDERKGS